MRPLALLLLAALPLLSAAKKHSKKAPAAPSVKSVILQLESDWIYAAATRNAHTLDRILAADWLSTDFSGKTVTKPEALKSLNSAPAVIIDPGQVKVRVFGTTAIATGQDAKGQYGWIDVFLKREGRWQAVASQSTRIEH